MPHAIRARTLNVNLYAGPGVGKSVTAARLYAELKLRGVHAELVSEYAKELVYLGILEQKAQEDILKEQLRRQGLLQGQALVVVTDSPVPMSLVYAKRLVGDPVTMSRLRSLLEEGTNGWLNLDVLLNRDLSKGFETEGRGQTAAESMLVHRQISHFLCQHSPRHIELTVETALDALVSHVQAHLQSSHQLAQHAQETSTPPHSPSIHPVYRLPSQSAQARCPGRTVVGHHGQGTSPPDTAE